MQNLLSLILGYMNFAPGLKTKIAAVAAFLLAIVSAFNAMAPQVGIDFVITIPEWLNSAVLALLGIGAANQIKNAGK